jgi:hypothetical protein
MTQILKRYSQLAAHRTIFTHAAIAFLLLALNDAKAEWIEVDGSDIQTTYTEPSSIEVSGSKVSVWLLSSYKTPKKYDGKLFQSMMTQYEYDCRSKQYRILAYSLRAGKMGGEELHGETSVDKWNQIADGSADETLWQRVCTPESGWSKVGESKQMTVYANPFTLRKKGGRVRMWELFDFKSPQLHGSWQRYQSVRHQAEYDCKSMQYRTLEVEYHTDNMGKGEVVSDDDKAKKWEPIETGSADHLFWKMACGSK